MCIIVVKQKEQVFEPWYIEKMYDSGNRDGFGMMWNEEVDGKMRVKSTKSMGGWKELEEIYGTHMDKDLAVHVRNATFGDKNLANCHPYCVLDMDLGHKMDLYVMHNGTIREVQVESKMSDSWNFATHFLRPLFAKKPNLLQDDDFARLLSAVIGPNKLVFLDSMKRFTIINSDMGQIHSTGVWVSNKNELKPYEYRVAKAKSSTLTHEVHSSTSTSSSSEEVNFAHGVWVRDNDLRLHFRASPKKDASEEKVTSTTNDKAKDGTGNGIQLSDDLDEEGLQLILQKIPMMEFDSVFQFVNEYHVESSIMLDWLTKQPVEKIRIMISGNPWEAAKLLHKEARKKYGTVNTAQEIN